LALDDKTTGHYANKAFYNITESGLLHLLYRETLQHPQATNRGIVAKLIRLHGDGTRFDKGD